MSKVPESIRWSDGRLTLLDQRALPEQVVWCEVEDVERAVDAIRSMVVRGAPAIGITAAYALAIAADQRQNESASSESANVELSWLRAQAQRLESARPTAVNLAWAVRRLVRVAAAAVAAATAGSASGALPEAAAKPMRIREIVARATRREAELIHAEDRAICRGIARTGLPLIRPNVGVLTHCNAGALAVSELGTATAPLYLAHERGVKFRVFADETRPVLQGARLTAWELHSAGIDVTLICDNMAAHLMSQRLIDLVIVGTDRVTANGDVVNKIGTLSVAIAARHFGIPFYVACPSSTYDPHTATGNDVQIEERHPDEVTQLRGAAIAPAGVKARNPAFDVTPVELVSGIITEHGLVRPPIAAQLAALLKQTLTLNTNVAA